MYKILFDCCNKYLENLAWKYPDFCPDNGEICGLDYTTFYANLKFDIPDLFRNTYGYAHNPVVPGEYDEYNQYALLDYIELITQNVRDITGRSYHSYFKHDHLTFSGDDKNCEIFEKYVDEINEIFKKTGLLYVLTDHCEIDRVIENDTVTPVVEAAIKTVSEKGTRELLQEAIHLYRNPRPENQHLAVEKMWDAFERLKTYYSQSLDKRNSANKIINDMASGDAVFITLFTTEFEALTKVGNNYRIRHHEIDKKDMTDERHFDYLFNRCLSLIALAIQYLH